MSSGSVCWVLVPCVVACGDVGSEDELGPSDLILANVTVIDGFGGSPRPGRTVEIRDGIISEIRDSQPGDTGTIDAGSLYLTPGIIDTHVHLPWNDEGALRAHLDSLLSLGITSVRDMACCADVYARMMDSPDSASFARVFYSAFLAGPGFHAADLRAGSHPGGGARPWSFSVLPDSDVDSVLSAARQVGVRGAKVYSNLLAGRIQEIVESAHRGRLRAWSHAVVFPTRPSEVVATGVDVVSHAALFVWEGAETLPDTYNGDHPFNPFGPPAPYSTVAPGDPRVLTVLEEMRDLGTILDATLSTMKGAVGPEVARWGIELARSAHRLTIALAVGTDNPASGAVAIFDELEMLVDSVGLTCGRGARRTVFTWQ